MRNHFIWGSTICFVVPPLKSPLNHSTLHGTICVCLKPLVPRLNHSTLFWTMAICVCLKPFVSWFNHLTLHWTICVCLKPFVSRLNHSTLHWTIFLRPELDGRGIDRSLPISSIQTMSYITCKVEIENFTQPSLHYFTSPMNCLITWIRRRYLLLFFWTCPKLLIAFDTI